MLVIRPAQIEAMVSRQKNNAAATLAISLKTQSPFFQYYTDEQLNLWVTKQIDYLASVGIEDKKSVQGIIEVMALYGDMFERCSDPSWALNIIENKAENESIRALFLKEVHEERLEELVAEAYENEDED